MLIFLCGFDFSSVDENKYYDDENWIYACEGPGDLDSKEKNLSEEENIKRDENKICFLSQTLQHKEDKSIKLQIRFVPISEEILNLVLITHLGVDIPFGTSLVDKDNNVFAKGKYISCLEFGCISVATLTQADLSMLQSSDEIYVALFNTDNVKTFKNQEARHTINTKGLKLWLSEIKAF